jgi:hypothetical protein
MIAGWCIACVTGQAASAPFVWNWTWAVTNIAVLAGWRHGGFLVTAATLPAPHAVRTACLAFAASYVLFFWGAVRVVPPQGDHDFDLQGTAHALTHRFVPAFETSRSKNYFAHPPLLHLYVAGSFLYFDRLDRLAVYDPASVAALSPDDQWRYYQEHPFLIETRTPNIFLGAVVVAILAAWIAASSGSLWFGLLLALAYASLPEVFVRSSYGGYFAISKFASVVVLLVADRWIGDRAAVVWRAGLLAGGLAALTNHKLVLLPVAIVVWSVVTGRKAAPMGGAIARAIHPIAVGFVIGTALFWAYGLSIDPADFWNDHVRKHIVDRIAHHDVSNADPDTYPSVAAVWHELWRDTNYLLLPLGTCALLLLIARRRSRGTATGGIASPLAADGSPLLWAIWIAAVAIAFSLVDWRQAKHLTALIVPMILAPAFAVSARRIPRVVVVLVVAVLLVLNARVIALLAGDFSIVRKVPEW